MREVSRKLVIIGAAVVLSGCAVGRFESGQTEARPLGSGFDAYRAGASGSGAEERGIKEPSGNLTLRAALGLALMNNPELASFAWDIRIAEAKALEARMLPNPGIEFEVEDFGGSGDPGGFDGAESTLLLSQVFETGGKRRKRAGVANQEGQLAEWLYEGKRLDVFVETAKRFAEVLASQEQVRLSEEYLGLAHELRKAAKDRVEAGKAAPIEEMKAAVAVSERKIDLEKAKLELEAARNRLSGMWGGPEARFHSGEADFEIILESVPPRDRALELIDQNPDLEVSKTLVELTRAELERERAAAIPDLEISGGLQRFEETGDTAYIAGIGIALPLFNRNKAGVAVARHSLAKAQSANEAARLRLKNDFLEAYNLLSISRLEAVTLRDEAIPAAEKSFANVDFGYKQGKFGYLEVLDSQGTLFGMRQRYIDALLNYHKAVADVERITGQSIVELNNEDRSNNETEEQE